MVPSYNPREIVSNLKRLIGGETQQPLHPWYSGFKGKISPDPEKKRYIVSGIWKRVDKRTIEITELPVGTWTQDYKEFLMRLMNSPDEKKKAPAFLLSDLKDHSTEQLVHFVIEASEDLPESDEVVEKALKLTTYLSVANMTLFDSERRIRQWDSATAILDEFYTLRLQLYDKRKDYMVDTLREEWKKLDNKVRFILAVVNKEIVVNNRKKADLLKELRDKKFDPFSVKKAKKKTADEEVAVESEESEGEEETEEGKDSKANVKKEADSAKDFDYLLSMPLWNLTLEKVQELVRQRDSKSDDLKVLIGTAAKQLWLRDLEELETAMDARDVVYAELQEVTKTLKKKGAKLKAKRPRKVTKVSDDDDDEYSGPKSKKAAPKKPTPSVPKPAPVKPAAAAKAAKTEKAEDDKKSNIRSFFSPGTSFPLFRPFIILILL